jgi:tyramine---L-glutamate ligase
MRRAIANDFACLPGDPIKVIVTSDARLPDEPGPWTIARIGARADPGQARELARTADFTVLIAPETRGILSSLTRDFENAGAQLLGSTADAVELAADKVLLAARLQALSIATPPSRAIVPSGGLPHDAIYPAVLKPIDGAGSVDTFFLADAQSLPACARDMPVAVLQPFVPGIPMSASFFVETGGRSWLIGVGIQRMATRDGRFEYRGGTLPAPCRDALAQLKPAVDAIAGLGGFVGVDFIWNAQERHATILEINPRPTTSYVGLSRLVPPGLLARSWLAACEPAARDLGILEGLAEYIHESRGFVSFKADGEVDDEVVGVPI